MGRNVLAMSGLRVLSKPFQAVIGSLSRGLISGELKTTAGDFTASMVVAFLTMPLNQLYNFLTISPVYRSMALGDKLAYAAHFLSDSYLLRREDGSIVGLQ